MSGDPVIVGVRCSRRMHAVRIGTEVVLTNHDEDAERVLVALGGPRPPCLELADGLRALALEVGVDDMAAWACVGVDSVEMWQAWSALGATSPDGVAAWSALGEATPKTAGAWVSAGARSAADVDAWMRADVASPLRLREWVAAGITDPHELLRWRSARVRGARTCGQWRRLTVVPEEVAMWRAARVRHADDAARWGMAGVRTVVDLDRWRSIGIEATEALEWSRARIGVENVPAWRAVGVRDGADARRWRAGGASSPDVVRGWLAAGVRSRDVGAWHDVGCRDVDDLDLWMAYGFGADALRWQGVAGVQGAMQWRAEGVDDPDEMRRWTQLRGFVWPGEIPLWRRTDRVAIDDAELLTQRDLVPAPIVVARQAEAARIGLDGGAFGGLPDRQVDLSGDRPGAPSFEQHYFYRADGRRAHADFAEMVRVEVYDVDGDVIPELALTEWLPRPPLPDVVELHVECTGTKHLLLARRVRRRWVFESEHDVDAERTLVALGGRPPRCAAAAEVFRAVIGSMPADRAAAWAETGAVMPSQFHFMQRWKIKKRPVDLFEAVRWEHEGVAPKQVGDPFPVGHTVAEWFATSADALVLQADAPMAT